MRYGFVIDQTKCIGCHACTVACKAEHDIPLGAFRTWVTYSETGTFPDSRRHFQVNRCNHCANAPCVTVCPTGALFRRPDGIVDFDRTKCIGCKACIAACPYDAIYIDPDDHTAAKCNFCAHRVDRGILPACVDVCPAKAIVAGDLDDPRTLAARLVARTPVAVRKPEQNTRPGVFYIGADASTLDPTRTSSSPLYAFATRPEPVPITLDATLAPDEGRRVYDPPHLRVPWGPKVSLYLWTKSLAAGIGGLGGVLQLSGAWRPGPGASATAAAVALAFLLATTALLVGDLKRPERFYLMFVRPQWRSWLVRGGIALAAYGALLAAWLASALLGAHPGAALWLAVALGAAASAGYSAFLFGQAQARDFWQSPLVLWHLLVQAAVAGSAYLLVVAGGDAALRALAMRLLLGGLLAHLAFALGEVLSRHATREAALAAHAATRGALARLFWGAAMGVGGALALAALALAAGTGALAAAVGAAVLALAGLWAYEHTWVQAGQSVPLS
jgi:Fe-S-cluster-containing dehydrogenase component